MFLEAVSYAGLIQWLYIVINQQEGHQLVNQANGRATQPKISAHILCVTGGDLALNRCWMIRLKSENCDRHSACDSFEVTSALHRPIFDCKNELSLYVLQFAADWK